MVTISSTALFSGLLAYLHRYVSTLVQYISYRPRPLINIWILEGSWFAELFSKFGE